MIKKEKTRHLFFILSMIWILTSVTSCENENVKKLKREIEATDNQCPYNMGMLGDILSLKYDEKAKDVQMYFLLNNDLLSIETLENNEQTALQSMKLSFSKGESREMLELMINSVHHHFF